MPVGYEAFRTTCGTFVFTLSYILLKKEKKAKAKIRGLKIPNRVSGFMVGLLFVYFFWGGWLLQCGDTEPNLGPKSSKRLHFAETEPKPGPSTGLTLSSPPKRPRPPEQPKPVSANCVLCKGCGKTIQVI